MKNFKYFFQFLGVLILLLFLKILGKTYSLKISGKIFSFVGPLFRSKKICEENLIRAFPKIDHKERERIISDMWFNYGTIFAEYLFMKNFRFSRNDKENIIIENQEELETIKNNKEPVIFLSGHFNNFELMAMHIEKSGIDLTTIYRPLNNIFLNPLMERIRKKYICKKQIKKGISGTKELVRNFKGGSSIALMIDQRVSQGIKVNFFNEKAYTTTIPAQFVKKYNAKVVPIYIQKTKNNKFKLTIFKSVKFNDEDSIESITTYLNKVLEKMIIQNPSQWIWTHNRWK